MTAVHAHSGLAYASAAPEMLGTAFAIPGGMADRAQPPAAFIQLRGVMAVFLRALSGAGRSERQEQRLLQNEIRRLEQLSPHLLFDIGVRQVAPGGYVIDDPREMVSDGFRR